MYSMPGKIAFVKKVKIRVTPSDIEIRLNSEPVKHYDGHFEILDEPTSYTMTFNKPVETIHVEDLSVTHLLKDNKLPFITPIYRWLIDHVDNK